MNREELIAKIAWSEGGYRVDSMFMAFLPQPKEPRGADDWPSVVFVHGPADKYTDDELATLLDFSQRRTAWYDERFNWRVGANFILIDKPEYMVGSPNPWMSKRSSWDRGNWHHPTLEAALRSFEEEIA